ncbi:MAG: alpha/beta fold hydrolase [Promethearchaeota archaeon]
MQVELSNCSLNCEVIGEGTPLLFIHGYGSDLRLMKLCMEPIFSKKDQWKRIYIDIPGNGLSKAESWITSVEDLLSILLEFINKIIGVEPFAIMGQSYGGYLGRAILKHRFSQVTGIFLLCSVVIAEHAARDHSALQVLQKNPELIASLEPYDRRKYCSIAVVQSPYTWRRYRDEFLAGIKICDREFYKRIHKKYEFTENIDELNVPFTKPTVILCGRQDNIVGYRDHLRLLVPYSHASYIVLDRAGHNLEAEQPVLFAKIVQNWFNALQN